MTSRPDAIAYLLELRDDRDEPWFSRLCDVAISAKSGDFATDEIRAIVSLLLSGESYQPVAAHRDDREAGPLTPSAVSLRRLGPFHGFKRLEPSLQLDIEKRCTLIYGLNGAGKSSVCQAIKVLAESNRPDGPLGNARRAFVDKPTFEYVFEGEEAKSWDESAGFGVEAERLRFFDASIAVKFTSDPLQPSESVEVTPFRLEVFDYARALVEKVQEGAEAELQVNQVRLQAEIAELTSELGEHASLDQEPLASLARFSAAHLAEALEAADADEGNSSERIEDLKQQEPLLVSATSESGLRNLKSQLMAFEGTSHSLSLLIKAVEELQKPQLAALEEARNEKAAALKEVRSRCLPHDGNSEDAENMLLGASKLGAFDAVTVGQDVCPLCRRTHDDQSASQFRVYSEYLSDSIRKELDEIDAQLGTIWRIVEVALGQEFPGLAEDRSVLPAGDAEGVRLAIGLVMDALPRVGDPLSGVDRDSLLRVAELRDGRDQIDRELKACQEALDAAASGRSELLRRLAAVREELRRLEFQDRLRDSAERARNVVELCEGLEQLRMRVEGCDFRVLRTAMTNKGKEASKSLVLAGFESRLDAEYQALSGQSMVNFGVSLRASGDRQQILVHPEVGGLEVRRVLSEGEQKVHALAAFFCQATMAPHQVLVFDDPVGSFDFNYTDYFCNRLRDLIADQVETQVVIFTHSWEFFIRFQKAMKRPDVKDELSVLLLESCALIRSYVERERELEQEVRRLVDVDGDPDSSAKFEAMRCMRVLVEVIVNTYAFAGLRQQFKKDERVSLWGEYTKLMPLTSKEADRLRDLYGHLSPAHHDDATSHSTDRTKQQLLRWLEEILEVRDALRGRRDALA